MSTVVSLPGSGLVFNNDDTELTSLETDAIVAAETYLQGQFNNSVTISLTFDLSNLTGSASSNVSNFVAVSYAALGSALSSHATTAKDIAAVNALPGTPPSDTFYITTALANVLGLSDDPAVGTATINDNGSVDLADESSVTGLLEHEISEVMGLTGGLGDQNGVWGPMDLFRYDAAGVPDYTDGRDGLETYLSLDGKAVLTHYTFTNNYINSTTCADAQLPGDAFADPEDWSASPTVGSPLFGDAFGSYDPLGMAMSATDVSVMDILGWTPYFGQVWATESGTFTAGEAQYADVTGDGKMDLIFQGLDNSFWVSLATGTGFAAPRLWATQGGSFAAGEAQNADVSGNGKMDLIFQRLDNSFWVSLATETGFDAPQLWATEGGSFTAGEAQYADVTGSGKMDLIFQDADNSFWVSLATGTGFEAPQLWATGNGSFVAGQAQYADLTGNGKMDLIFQDADNRFWVSLATGTGFAAPQLWATEGGLFVAGEAQYADVTGNGRMDLLFQGLDNKIWVSLSTGTGFAAPQLWATENGPFADGDVQYADVTGDGKADLIYQGANNQIWVSASTGHSFNSPVSEGSFEGSFSAGQLKAVDVAGSGSADLVFQTQSDAFIGANGFVRPTITGTVADRRLDACTVFQCCHQRRQYRANGDCEGHAVGGGKRHADQPWQWQL